MRKGKTMKLRDYIEKGIKKAGTLQALSNEIGTQRPQLSNAKSLKMASATTIASNLRN
jgi:hypothetical protein